MYASRYMYINDSDGVSELDGLCYSNDILYILQATPSNIPHKLLNHY